MEPFKPDEKVITKIKGVETEVTVRLIWNNEVQVKCPDGTLRWRTAKTVRVPNAATPENVAGDDIAAPAPVPAVSENASPNPEPQIEQPSPEPIRSETPDATQPTPAASAVQQTVLNSPAPQKLTACGGDVQPVVKNKKRRRK